MKRSVFWILAISGAACGPHDEGARAELSGEEVLASSDQTLDLLPGLGDLLDALLPDVPRCKKWRSLSAALGSRTIDCLGTIGPGQYAVENGRLVPRFSSCKPGVNPDVHADIRALLSVQRRDSDAASCLADRYQAWVSNFARTRIKSCPNWEKVATIDAPTSTLIDALATTLPVLPVTGELLIPAPHENYLVRLEFPNGDRDLRCLDAASCARQCSDAFPGLWISGLGNSALIDPTYWLTSVDYSSTSNPFMRPGYHHGMSYVSPPEIYGHANRASEPCSRLLNGVHMLYTLKLDCLDAEDRSTCISVCKP